MFKQATGTKESNETKRTRRNSRTKPMGRNWRNETTEVSGTKQRRIGSKGISFDQLSPLISNSAKLNIF